jgi:hypothetical protein
MAITIQNGSIVVRDGKIGTEQACCCGGCSGPCDDENPCPEGCACVDGECVAVTSCAGTCVWTNDADFEGPPVGGWYLQVPGCEDEENCQCGDPVALCGEAPEYDPEDPEGTVDDCTTGCEANPLP